MTIAVWRIATDTPDYEADDLSGAGAEATGGRWNRAGRPVLYASTTIALACLETLVHTNISQLPLNRFLVRLEVPDDVWAACQEETMATLPVGWSASTGGEGIARPRRRLACRRQVGAVVGAIGRRSGGSERITQSKTWPTQSA